MGRELEEMPDLTDATGLHAYENILLVMGGSKKYRSLASWQCYIIRLSWRCQA